MWLPAKVDGQNESVKASIKVAQISSILSPLCFGFNDVGVIFLYKSGDR